MKLKIEIKFEGNAVYRWLVAQRYTWEVYEVKTYGTYKQAHGDTWSLRGAKREAERAAKKLHKAEIRQNSILKYEVEL